MEGLITQKPIFLTKYWFKNLADLIFLLKTADNVNELDRRRVEMADTLPGIEIMFDYDQQNSAHPYDLWKHCLYTVMNLPRQLEDDMLYLAALLHDVGKPACRCKGKRAGDTNIHYYGHPQKSMEIVRSEIIPTVRAKGNLLSEKEINRLLYYVRFHDDPVNLRLKCLRRHLQMASLDEFQKLMLLQVADAKAHVQIPIVLERIRICEILSGDYAVKMYEEIQAEKSDDDSGLAKEGH